jgi:polar amino acid transport system substrate-binding protein
MHTASETNAFCRTWVAVFLVGLLGGAAALAQADSAAGAPPSLRVATRQVPPFAMQGTDGEWRGIAIDLWQQAAEELGFTSTFEEADIDEMIAGLQDGRYDAAVAALTMTSEREAQIDFLHPYFDAGLGIAVRPTGNGAWWSLLRSLISVQFFTAVGSLALLLLLVGLLVWYVERRRNPEQFGGNTLQGIGSGFWWSAVTMTTVGYGDKAPATVAGRLVGLVWMFASIIIISGMTAAIASALTVSQLSRGISGPEDLPGTRVGTVAGTTSENYLRDRLIDVRLAAESPEAALQALADGKLDAVVYDAPILRYLVNRETDAELEVLPREFEPQNYALAVPPGSELREPLNRLILERTRGRAWQEVVGRYLGGGR